MSNKKEKIVNITQVQQPESVAPLADKLEEAAGPSVDSVRPLEDATAHIDALTGDMPQVVPEAVQAQAEALNRETANTPDPGNAPDLVDRYGRKFSPDLHATDANGKPVKTRDGNISLKRGAKQKLNLPGDKPGDVAQAPGVDVMAAKRRATAQVVAGTFIQTSIVIFGDEWKPEISKEFNEVEFLTQATDDYMKVAGFKEMPPWMGLAVAYGSYVTKRLNKPQTQAKLKTWFQAVKDKIVLWWVNRNNKKGVVKNAPRSDIRDNGNGKNDVSVPISEVVQK